MWPLVIMGAVLAFALLRKRRDDELEQLDAPPPGGAAHGGASAGDLLGGGQGVEPPAPELVNEADRAAIARPVPSPSSTQIIAPPESDRPLACYRNYRGVFRWPREPEGTAEWLLLEVWDGSKQSGDERLEIEQTLRRFWPGVFPHGVWALGVECGADAFDMYQVVAGEPGVPPLG